MSCIKNINKIQIIKLEHYDIFKSNILKSNKLCDIYGSNTYLGKCTKTQKDIAIKHIIINNISKHKESCVKYEIKVANFLKDNPHKNIIQYIDIMSIVERSSSINDIEYKTSSNNFMNTTSDVYIIVEYDDDYTGMSKLIVRDTFFPEYLAKKYFIQILEALSYLDENNISHKNIKLNNVLVNTHDLVKLDDIVFMSHVARTRYPVCNFEQKISKSVTCKHYQNEASCDVLEMQHAISLGYILYEMVYGKQYGDFDKVDERGINKQLYKNIPDSQENDEIHVSYECRDLLKQLIEKNIKLNDIVKHKWITNDSEHNTIFEKQINSIKEYIKDDVKDDTIFEMEL